MDKESDDGVNTSAVKAAITKEITRLQMDRSMNESSYCTEEVSIYAWLYNTNRPISEAVGGEMKTKLIDHWKCFPMPRQLVLDTLGVIYVIIGISAVVCNLTVIFICCKRPLKTLSDLLTLNLVISDSLMSLTEVPPLILSCFVGRWAFEASYTCSMYGFYGALFGTLSIVTITAIAVDRYLAIVPPYNQRKLTKSNALPWMVFIWIYSILWTIPPLLGWNEYVLEGGLVACSFDYLSEDEISRSYVLSLFVAVYCLPLLIIIFCYTTITISIWKQKLIIRQSVTEERSGNEGPNVARKQHRAVNEFRIFKIFLYGVVLWFVAWTPYATVALIGFFGDRKVKMNVTPLTAMIPAAFAKIASCYNPILFALKNPVVRYELQRRYRHMMSKVCGGSECQTSSDERRPERIALNDIVVRNASSIGHRS